MQTLGMLYADEIVYIFENSNELLRIPRLPLDIDNASKNLMRQQSAIFRKLSLSPCKWKECQGISEALLFRLGDECELSEWGKVLWQRFKSELYGESLLPPPSPRIVYGKSFEKAAQALASDEVRLVNEKIDDLYRFLTTQENLSSLSLSPVHGNAVPGCTHEFYLWSHKAADRAYGRFVKDTFVIETMGAHL